MPFKPDPQFLPKSVNYAVKSFGVDVMKLLPSTMGHLMTYSPLDNKQVSSIGEGLTMVTPWFGQQDSLGGQPGVLAAARLRATDIADPAIRAQALSLLDAIQRRPLGEQQAWVSFVSGRNADKFAFAASTGLDAVPAVGETLANAGVSGGLSDSGGLELAGEDSSIDVKTALGVIFPGLDTEIGAELYANQDVLESITNVSDTMADYIYERSPSARSLTDTLDQIQQGTYKGSFLDASIDVISGYSGGAFDVATSVLGSGARGVPGGTIVADKTSYAANITASGAAWSLGKVFSVGLDENDPNYEADLARREKLFGIVTIFAPAFLAPVTRRLKTVRGAISRDVAEAALDSTHTIPRGGVLGVASEVVKAPIRATTALIDKAVLHWARDPVDFFVTGIHGRKGQALLDTIDEAKLVHPGDIDGQLGFVHQKYGSQIDTDLARRMLEQTTRDGAERIFVGTATGPAGREAIDALKSELDGVNRQMDLAEKQGLTGTPAYDRNRLRAFDLEWKLKTSTIDSPMLSFPKQSAIRSAVRGVPTNGFQRFLHWAIAKDAVILDPMKLVDELPHTPQLIVPKGRLSSVDQGLNIDVISKYMNRAGVDARTIERTIGEMSGITNQQAFYEFIEHKVFGKGGHIDKALHPKITPELRSSIITLHDTAIEHRARSNVSSIGPDGRRVTHPVLETEIMPGEFVPLPSRPSEFLSSVRLPSVDKLIEADSMLRRGVARLKARGGAAAGVAQLTFYLPKTIMELSTLIMKPLVMVVRLPAMAMRIQMEQALRITSLGYRPFKGIPKGISLFPGGIPIPFTKSTQLGHVKVLQGLFGEDGWNLISPDPRFKGFSDPLAPETGMFMSEMMDRDPAIRSVESTADFRSGRRQPKAEHWEARRDELEAAHNDFLDREIAALGFDQEAILRFLDDNPTAAKFMDTEMNQVLDRSTLAAAAPPPPDMAALDTYIEGRIDPRFQKNAAGQYVNTQPERLTPVSEARDWDRETSKFQEQLAAGQVQDLGDGVYRRDVVLPHVFSGQVVVQGHDFIATVGTGPDLRVVGYRSIDENGSVITRVDPEFRKQGRGLKLIMAHWKEEGVTDVAGIRTMVGKNDLTPDSVALNKAAARKILGEQPVVALVDPRTAWIDQRIAYVKGITLGNPVFERAVATGRLRELGEIGPDTLPDGRNIVAEINHKREQIDVLTAEINDTYLDPDVDRNALAALQRQRLDTMRAEAALTEAYPELHTRSVKLSDKKRARTALKGHWEDASWELPDTLNVEKHVRPWHHDGGILDDMEKWSSAANNLLYRPFKALSWVDQKGTRGSLFSQAYQRSEAMYLARGFDPAMAKTLARARAGDMTRDIMYDLTARTSTQRALKDIFWFAPATQEVLYTWLVKIPAASYWPIGAAALVGKGVLAIEVLKQVGVIQEIDGEDVVVYPGLAAVLSKVTGKPVPPIVYGKVSGLNLVTQNFGIPGLSTGANFALGEAALKWGGFFKTMSDIFQPYGPQATILPQPITYLHEAVFGEPPPWEFMSPDRLKADWDRTNDVGIQYAYTEMAKEGILPPKPEDYGTLKEDGTWDLSVAQETAYGVANQKYLDELFKRGHEQAQGQAWVRFIGSTVSPMSLFSTSEDREKWTEFWKTVVVPDGFGSAGLSDSQHQQIDDFLKDHPDSVAFSTFYSGYGDKETDLPFAEDLDDAFFDDYYTGARRTLDPHEFSLKLMGMQSLRYYQSVQSAALDGISPERDPWFLLTHGAETSSATNAFTESWNRYLDLNPKIDALLTDQRARWVESENVPVKSFESQRLAETKSLLAQIADQLIGEDGIRPDGLRDVQRQLSELYSERGEFGAPNTPAEKATAWWSENVMAPYLAQTTPLYEAAQTLESLGLPAAGIYNQIRTITEKAPPKYKGQTVPTVEEVFFGSRLPAEQQQSRDKWATRPLSWLTEFQLKEAGYNLSPETVSYLRTVSEVDTAFDQLIRDRGISYQSDEYKQLVANKDAALLTAAAEVGPEAVAAVQLETAEPYVRLNATGFAPNNETWQTFSQVAGSIVQSIEAQDLSARGFSEVATQYKVGFYSALAVARQDDPALDALFTQLSHAMPLPDGSYRLGATLYEAVFFGNFDSTHIPYDVAVAAAGGIYGQ